MNDLGCIPAKIYLQMYDLTKEPNFWPYSLISTLLMVNNTVVYTTLEVMYNLFLLLFWFASILWFMMECLSNIRDD